MDSHAHIDRFPEDERSAVLAAAWKAGLERIISVATSLDGVGTLRKLADENPKKVFCTVGVHPLELDGEVPSQKDFADAIERARPVAIGETGIDLHSMAADAAPQKVAEKQRRAFFLQACVARDANLPLIIHCRERARGKRDAWAMMQEVLKNARFDVSKALLHCFDYGHGELVSWQREGGFTSFSGAVTLATGDEVKRAALFTRMDRILLETDSPFLLPEPLRSKKVVKRCEPQHMVHTAKFLATLLDVEVDSLLGLSLKNGNNFFRLEP